MSQTSTALDPVKQFSIFAENRVGRLHDITGLLRRHNVHIMALTTLDTTDSIILRIIVDDPDKARELLINNDYPYSETNVLAVHIEDESKLEGVLHALLECEINIHYIYSFIKRAAVAMNIEDADVAAQSLNLRGYKTLTQGDISR